MAKSATDIPDKRYRRCGPTRSAVRLVLGAGGLALSLLSILLALLVPSLAGPALGVAIIGIVLAAVAYGMDIDRSLPMDP